MIPDGLFETVLVRDGRPVALTAHLRRLRASAARLGLPADWRISGASRRCRAAAAGGPRPAARLGVRLDASGLTIACEAFAGYPPDLYAKGAEAGLRESLGHPLRGWAGHKVLPYDALSSLREAARGRGEVDVILRDRDGALLEGCATNLFLATDRGLVTPPLARPVLPGITRAAVLAIARREGWPVREEDLGVEDLARAREAFLTGSLMEAMPLRRLGGHRFAPGPIAAALLARLVDDLD